MNLRARAAVLASIVAFSSLPITARPADDQARIARLVGICKLWGVVKYFHPYLAYKDIDWDAALVAALPKVDAATTPAEYEAAVNALLAPLGDLETHAEIVKPDATSQAPAQGSAAVATAIVPFKNENGTLVVTAASLRRAWYDPSTSATIGQQLLKEIDAAKSVVVDCRPDYPSQAYALGFFLLSSPSALVEHNLSLGTYRFRTYSGYAPQFGTTSGGYSSGFEIETPSQVAAMSTRQHKPTAYIVASDGPDLRPFLVGLQAAGMATVVEETAADAANDGFQVELADGVRAYVRTVELVDPKGRPGYHADATVARAAGGADPAMAAALASIAAPAKAAVDPAPAAVAVRDAHDELYPAMTFPSREYRLLALFRFWNVVNYFYPYKDLLDEPWDRVLAEFIPRFEADASALDYDKTVLELVAHVEDSHLWVNGANAWEADLGPNAPPIKIASVEEKTVVTAVVDADAAKAAGIAVGDVILAVDGEPVEKRIARLASLTAASTPQAMRWRVNLLLLRGAENSPARLHILGADGKERDVELKRSKPWAFVFGAGSSTEPAYKILPSGYGYVDLTRLQRNDADATIDAVITCPAIIFDMRGYPNGTAWTIAPRLAKEGARVPAALFRRPLLRGDALDDPDSSTTASFTFTQYLPDTTHAHYSGKVVMLIDENAISQSEHTCLFFESATNVTFVGLPTNGTDGDVTNLVLPGAISVSFTGHDVRHADGRQLQRVGIQPTVRAAPTIAGIRAGRDEVLDAAIAFLQHGKPK